MVPDDTLPPPHTHTRGKGVKPPIIQNEASAESRAASLTGPKWLQRPEKGGWLRVLLWLGGGTRVRNPCLQGLQFILVEKGSRQAFSSACPDVGERGKASKLPTKLQMGSQTPLDRV